MKHKDITALRNKTVAELDQMLVSLRRQSQKVGQELKIHRVKNVNAVKNLKREVAQISTIKNDLILKGNKI